MKLSSASSFLFVFWIWRKSEIAEELNDLETEGGWNTRVMVSLGRECRQELQ